MWNGTRDVSEQIKHNQSNYASGNPFGGTSETRYRSDSGTPSQNGGHHKGQLDILHKRGQKVNFSQDKLHGTENSGTKSSMTLEDFERIRADVDELLDAKDRLVNATPLRILEEMDKLHKAVDDTRVIANQVTGIDYKLNKLLESKDTLKKLDTFAQRADELQSLVDDFNRLEEVIRVEVDNFYGHYDKIVALTQTTDRHDYSLQFLTDHVSSLEERMACLSTLAEKEDFKKLEKIVNGFENKLTGIVADQRKLEHIITEPITRRHKVISLPQKTSNSQMADAFINAADATGEIKKLYKHLNEALEKTDQRISYLELKEGQHERLNDKLLQTPIDTFERTILNRLSGIEKRLCLLEEKQKK